MKRLPFLSVDIVGRTILIVLGVAIIALVYWSQQYRAHAQTGGTYELVMTFPESGVDSEENFGETFAPCRPMGNCNFSCNAANVGRTCSNLVCAGGSGDAAYFYTHEYACEYFPPACTADASCAAGTCSTDTCSDSCGNSYTGTKDCSVSCTVANACGDTASGVIVGSVCNATPPPVVDACPANPGLQCSASECTPVCTPDSSCAAGTCPFDTCTATAADCSTYPVSGTNWGACLPKCTPDTSCAASTCNDGSTCTATAADCSTYPIPGTNPGACAPTCSNGSPGPYPACPLSCTPTNCAPSTCTTDTCVNTNADCSTTTVPGTNPGACGAGPSVSCAPASQTIVAGGSATFTATAAGGAGPAYTWYDALGALLGSGTPFPKVYSTPGAYAARVKAGDGSGGFVYSTFCNVTVTSAACSNTGPVTLTATPNRVQTGSPTAVTFTSNASNVGAGNCTLSGPGIATQTYVPTSCSVTGATYKPTLTLTDQSTYTLSCPGGQFAKVIVNIVPKYREF